MALGPKRRMFIEAYLKCWNASEAARQAGYRLPGLAGHRLLKNDTIKAEIDRRIAEEAMGADEVLQRLRDQAKFDPTPYMDSRGAVDIDALKAAGLGHLIKLVRPGRIPTVEFHDGQVALLHLGKHHKLFTEKVEVAVSGPIKVIRVREMTKEE